MKSLEVPRGMTSGRLINHIRNCSSVGEVTATVQLLTRLNRIRVQKINSGYAVLIKIPDSKGHECTIGVPFKWTPSEAAGEPTAADGILLSKTIFENMRAT